MKINFKNQAKKYILGLSLFTIILSSCDKDFENDTAYQTEIMNHLKSKFKI